MAEDSELRRDLLMRIEARRAAVQAFLRQNRPRIRRRTNLTIVLSSLAAAFTAGPALGGQSFAESVQRSLGLVTDSIVWQLLCLAALAVSVGAAVLTNIAKSQDSEARLSTVEAVNAELDGLAGLLHYGHLPLEDAVKLYQQYMAKIPFVEDVPAYGSRAPQGWGQPPSGSWGPPPGPGARPPGGWGQQ
jgi:cytochrome bd-type quinol oxidase subunit 2